MASVVDRVEGDTSIKPDLKNIYETLNGYHQYMDEVGEEINYGVLDANDDEQSNMADAFIKNEQSLDKALSKQLENVRQSPSIG